MIAEAICLTSCGLVAYHHLGYPLALKALARRQRSRWEAAGVGWSRLPSMTMIVPAHNEDRFIEAKIANCAEFDYPEDRLGIVIVCDGCTDATVGRARDAIERLGARGAHFGLVVHEANRGKVATLNAAIAACDTDLVALSDASAKLSQDALVRSAWRIAEDRVGFVTGAYSVPYGTPAQKFYWRYQTAVKRDEAALDSPFGAHGAFYVFPRALWTPLEPDTINDDVILPMRIVARGFRGVYDPAIAIVECEHDRPAEDLRRRQRLGAGAMQQTLRLAGLADPRRPGLAFVFLSGKALRAVMPFVLIAALVSSLALGRSSPAFAWLLAAQLALYAIGLAGMAVPSFGRLTAVRAIAYLVSGYAAAGYGAVRYLFGGYRAPWTRVAPRTPALDDGELLTGTAAFGKRALDVAIAGLVLVVFAVLFVPVALAIKLESKGPVFYRQLRVGLRTPTRTRLFYMTKFRTMRTDAETKSGAVWATERDPRITRVGNFLRKTRLDELPQCIDVLRGDMSVVGPRPERPQFFSMLEREIPFYAERTYGVKPGITGLAQVYLPYDSSVEDVRLKVLHDHAYALRLMAPGKWLATDLGIMLRTFSVMILGKGR
ncbi:lipopolysaccharide/colanic/teichoic acid biosynthesis glycosyltransferase [Roseiarcus fermentans]|uniref:Lipopolysaccharide/colanic/teichoic acid biosynthesis glycosyltransferase n=1 Tax=Roseiarcus fermentans TaxID=1473586 RepID=A0A366FNE9_9HYPH|nr:sugar transferase [Roseiarcus fermentans]RBP16091.1 lipopolysaccharide/colanic/teichoic acid biosynthesis glycosyltransferase [Roseiarcus fermentans]